MGGDRLQPGTRLAQRLSARRGMTRVLLGRALLLAGLLLLSFGISEYLRPQLLLVGNITVDLVDGKHAVGGAISYAAAVASAYGVKACIVTAAGPDADLSIFEGHELHVVPAEQTLTFEHTYTWWGNQRKLRVTAQPNVTLTIEHVPPRCRRARIMLLGPLTPADMLSTSFVSYQQVGILDRLLGWRPQVGLMAQGLQRGLDAAGRVLAFKLPSQDLMAALGSQVSVFLSDVETDPWPSGTVSSLAQRSARWLVTRGASGAEEYSPGGRQHLPPAKVEVMDTNGAGDTFATAYMLALARWDLRPGETANWAASRAVGQQQACKPQCVQAAIAAHLPWGGMKTWVHQHWELALRWAGVPEATIHPDHTAANHAAVEPHAINLQEANSSGPPGPKRDPKIVKYLNRVLRRLGLRPVTFVPPSTAVAAIAES